MRKRWHILYEVFNFNIAKWSSIYLTSSLIIYVNVHTILTVWFTKIVEKSLSLIYIFFPYPILPNHIIRFSSRRRISHIQWNHPLAQLTVRSIVASWSKLEILSDAVHQFSDEIGLNALFTLKKIRVCRADKSDLIKHLKD